MIWLLITIFFLIFILTGLALLNLFSAVRLERFGNLKKELTRPSISVLIPVRNESENLKHLLPCFLNSEFKPNEIIIFDDQSSDDSAQVANSLLSSGNTEFKILSNPKWTSHSGLTGKNHGSQVLAEAAKSEILLFCDADMRFSSKAIGRSLSVMQYFQSSGITALPLQVAAHSSERLLLGLIVQLSIICTVPLRFAWRWPISSVQVGNGQWILIRKDHYLQAGGHKAMGSEILDDMTLARTLVQKKIGSLLPVLAAKDLSVAMYKDWNSLVDGFAKNLILLFGGNVFLFSLIFLVFNVLFLSPLWLLFFNFWAAGLALFLLLLLKNISQFLFSEKMNLLIDYFRSLFLLNDLVFRILWRRLRGESPKWKGRTLEQN